MSAQMNLILFTQVIMNNFILNYVNKKKLLTII